MVAVPATYRDLFDKRTVAHVVTLNPDGSPHATPVWIDLDDVTGHILVNTERHRRKTRNVDRRPRVAVSMTDPSDPYRYLSVTGRVSAISAEGARDHIDALARRYTDAEKYTNPIRTERVILRVAPEEILTDG